MENSNLSNSGLCEDSEGAKTHGGENATRDLSDRCGSDDTKWAFSCRLIYNIAETKFPDDTKTDDVQKDFLGRRVIGYTENDFYDHSVIDSAQEDLLIWFGDIEQDLLSRLAQSDNAEPDPRARLANGGAGNDTLRKHARSDDTDSNTSSCLASDDTESNLSHALATENAEKKLLARLPNDDTQQDLLTRFIKSDAAELDSLSRLADYGAGNDILCRQANSDDTDRDLFAVFASSDSEKDLLDRITNDSAENGILDESSKGNDMERDLPDVLASDDGEKGHFDGLTSNGTEKDLLDRVSNDDAEKYLLNLVDRLVDDDAEQNPLDLWGRLASADAKKDLLITHVNDGAEKVLLRRLTRSRDDADKELVARLARSNVGCVDRPAARNAKLWQPVRVRGPCVRRASVPYSFAPETTLPRLRSPLLEPTPLSPSRTLSPQTRLPTSQRANPQWALMLERMQALILEPRRSEHLVPELFSCVDFELLNKIRELPVFPGFFHRSIGKPRPEKKIVDLQKTSCLKRTNSSDDQITSLQPPLTKARHVSD